MSLRKIVPFSLLVLGFSSIVVQVVAIRELAAGFYGNEFFIGWTLFSWLFWTGLGSAYASSRRSKTGSLPDAAALCSVLAAVLAFLTVILIRCNRLILGHAPGTLPDLIPSLIYSFVAVGPLCFVLGEQFSILVRIFFSSKAGLDPARVTGRAYFLETAGFILGGVVFSFFLVRSGALTVMSVVMGANFLVAALIMNRGRRNLARAAWVIFSFLVTLAVLTSGWLEKSTLQFRFKSEELVASKNTLRGNIAVTRLKDQHNFYQNGMLLGADREEQASEYLVHFPMLAHPAPRKVLLLGTGLNGPLMEILKHEPEEVVAVDLDPEFTDLAARYLPSDLRKVLADRRIRFWHGDSRFFFRDSRDRFDVIIANFPDPLSILVNRNYTGEFFGQAREHLAAGGVFATHLGFAANYVTPELERLGTSIYATLRKAFDTVKVLPEDTVYFLASSKGPEFTETGPMIERLRERRIAPGFVTADYLRYRFTNDRVDQVTTVFNNSVWKVKNLDFRPQGYYFAFARWLSQFHSRAAGVLLRITEIPFAVVLIAFILFFSGPLLLSGSPEGNARRLSLAAIRTAGFTVMTFEIVLIYLFQVFFGDLYFRIAGLITVLMTGIGIGVWAAEFFKRRSSRVTLFEIHATAAAFYAILILTILKLRGDLMPGGWQVLVFYGFAAFGGILAGLEFPFANDLFLKTGKGEGAGVVYAADLFGSCLGAFMTAGFLLPIWGVRQTLAVLVAVNAVLMLFLLLRKNLGGKDV